MTASVLASVIVPSYRGEAKLRTLLPALAAQDAAMDSFEVVVVVDGLLDDSPSVVAQAAEQGLAVRAVVHEANRGRVHALNSGFEAAEGEVLIRCDDDLEPAPDYVSGHVARHRGPAQPVGVVGLCLDQLPPSRYSTVYGSPREARLREGAYVGEVPTWRYWAANCSVTRTTWQTVGGYDTAYAHYGWEDVDYGYRLHEAGVRVVLAPELETVHHGAATSTLSRTLRAYHSGAARTTFEGRHPGVLSSPSAGTGWWGALVSAATRLSSEGRYEQTAALIDRTLPYVPSAVAEKLVALAVESASLAGYAHADTVSARF